MTHVLIPKSILRQSRAYLDNQRGNVEHGGLLLGMRKPSAIQVHSVTFPEKWDVSTLTRFHRSQRGHSNRAAMEWRASGETVDWVGEWHSHPFGTCFPSSIDRHSWRKIVLHAQKPMVFLIFGRRDVYIGLQTSLSSNPMRLSTEEETNTDILFG